MLKKRVTLIFPTLLFSLVSVASPGIIVSEPFPFDNAMTGDANAIPTWTPEEYPAGVEK